MSQPQPAVPEGVTVDAVDWLPSGTASGLIRVRGHAAAPLGGLPDLVIDHAGRLHRFTSLPDPRANLEPQAWRGAYVVNAELVAAAGHRMVLEWPGGAQLALPAVNAPSPPVAVEPAPVEEEPGGEVVERAVLAERRARRAEAAEQAQARIAREALRAVEVLELRANELEDKLREGGEPSDLQDRLSHAQAREAELAARVAELEAQVRERPAPAVDDRRADRLREALATTIVTIGQLRLQLHEAQLARRTRDVASGADAVRRTVAERERAELAAALSAARAELHDVREAGTRTSTMQADLAAREADLAAARERIAQLEAVVVEARQAAEQTAVAAAERAEAVAREAGDRAAAVTEEAGRRAEQAEAALAEVAERVQAAEARVRAAEVAREVAEAAAVAAASERRAAEVAHAARIAGLEAELAAARTARTPAAAAPAPPEVIAPPAPAPPTEPAPEPHRPPVPPDLAEQAAEQAAAARRAARATDRERIKADLEAAAQALRETPEEPARPTIVPARSELPRRIASGDARRLYPPLRGALVRLAHDDAAAAAEIIAGLVPAQWRVLNASVQYTLAIRELPEELHIVVNPGGAGVGGEARGPRVAASAHDLAQALAGHPPRIGRFGRIRVSGPRAVRRQLLALLESELTLEEAIRAGATIDPVLALRFLAYAVPTAWTRGHTFTVAQTITSGKAERTVYLTAGDARGLTCSTDPPAQPPDAHVTLSEKAFRTLMLDGVPEPDDRPATRGDHRAAEQLRAWADRVRRSDF